MGCGSFFVIEQCFAPSQGLASNVGYGAETQRLPAKE